MPNGSLQVLRYYSLHFATELAPFLLKNSNTSCSAIVVSIGQWDAGWPRGWPTPLAEFRDAMEDAMQVVTKLPRQRRRSFFFHTMGASDAWGYRGECV